MINKNEKQKLKSAFTQYSKNEYHSRPREPELSSVTFSEDFEKNMEKLIKKQKKPAYLLFNTPAKKAACFAAALLICLSCFAFSAGASKETLYKTLVDTYAKFSTIFFNGNNAPTSLEEYYVPEYIPEGYTLSKRKISSTRYYCEYTNSEGTIINYYQDTISNGETNYNTENAYVEKLKDGVYVYNEHVSYHSFKWTDGKYQYSVGSRTVISKEELLKIKESVSKYTP